MSVAHLLDQPWAITPQMLATMHDVYERHSAGAKFDAESVRAALGLKAGAAPDQPSYTVKNGVAVVPMQGVLAKKMDLFLAISGGMSTESLVTTVNEAIADPSVHSLLLDISSPGGEVDGTQQIGNAVAASTKPTLAWVDGMACSAAYWIAAQCDSIYADSDTAEVGSIAVVMQHTDRSKANEAAGKKITHITTGKYKRILNSDEPLSQEGRDYGQGKADYLHTLFVQAVAGGRGANPDTVASSWAQGQTYFAQQAIDAGLIDGIASLDDCIAKLSAAYQQTLTPTPTGAQMFKAFETEEAYNAEIAAAEERGRAAAVTAAANVDTPTESKQKLQSAKMATDIRNHQQKAKAEGRTLTVVQAALELEALASAEAA